MGCLNSEGQFKHWFGNIHLSGACNRSCYFCIGQHMMALDSLDTLNTWPLPGLSEFIGLCKQRGVAEVNLTGSNTDPLLYDHHHKLTSLLRAMLPGVKLGIRTNGIGRRSFPIIWRLYDKASISITSFDPKIYRATMGRGEPPNLPWIRSIKPEMPLKVNVVLCPETVYADDVKDTLNRLVECGIRTVNLREPYGQPHIGSPLVNPVGEMFGMPLYDWHGMNVVYWDVHYVEVESVNLYANGVVSETYPITKGHAPSGEVHPQEFWQLSGRQVQQWIGA